MVSKALLHTLFWISPRQSLVCHFQRWTVISTCAHTCNSSCLFTTYHSLFYFLLHSCFYFFLPTLQFTEPSCQGKSICLIYKYKYKMYLDLYFFCGILCLFLLLCPLFQHSHLIPFTGWMRLEGPSWSIWSFLVHLCSSRVTQSSGLRPTRSEILKIPKEETLQPVVATCANAQFLSYSSLYLLSTSGSCSITLQANLLRLQLTSVSPSLLHLQFPLRSCCSAVFTSCSNQPSYLQLEQKWAHTF